MYHNSIYNKYLLKISVFIRKCAMTERQSEQPPMKDGELRNNATNVQNWNTILPGLLFFALPYIMNFLEQVYTKDHRIL